MRYGYVALEVENGVTYFSLFLLVSEVWQQWMFRDFEGVTDVYQAASSSVVVNVAIQEGSRNPRFQLLVEIEGNFRWWMVYWRPDGDRVLLAAVRTTADPYTVVV